jgi:hypothetical protein
MAGRLASLLPRFVALPLLAVLGTATITFAANQQLSAPQAPPQPAAASVPAVLVVPDVRRQAFVFAKGTLEDAGFAWVVSGPVKGYAANTVTAQSPAAGTRVRDTGSPIVRVTLAANATYGQEGSPEDAAPYGGTELQLAGGAPVAEPEPEAEAEAAAPVATPKPAAKPKPAKKPAARPPAFVVAGAPSEPLDEMPLTDRARLLGRFLAAHPKPTNAAVGHFLYQHAWIVAGAEFGWWKGAEALELLIAVDRRAQRAWGIGAKSEANARASLARVKAAAAK